MTENPQLSYSAVIDNDDEISKILREYYDAGLQCFNEIIKIIYAQIENDRHIRAFCPVL